MIVMFYSIFFFIKTILPIYPDLGGFDFIFFPAK